MKLKDDTLLEEAYLKVVKEQDEKFSSNDPEMKELAKPSLAEYYDQEETPSIKIKRVEDIFDVYEEVGKSAELGLDDLISATVEDILRQIPKVNQVAARIAIKKMWIQMINDWKSFEGHL